ncbi:hypothetical protein GDI2674 [Gluconacetobacter diazotrophicus PA1 5]|uniref:Uncharacterized protein n=1 Tax=Gluconacetobacter diazotrophicus (strain ATCC 49037 / DSM 5601 / CCUG 37298 / CIP 103539 / LMG 7603 / PAl5) TaxID=272568 RepID=A9HPQ0_GLUDA|nr:hypothetical protein GDI2674 [Gluconacetobacter diazotrophicus PA1 5]
MSANGLSRTSANILGTMKLLASQAEDLVPAPAPRAAIST